MKRFLLIFGTCALLSMIVPVGGWLIGWAANNTFDWWNMVRPSDRGAYAGFTFFLAALAFWVGVLIYRDKP